MNRDSIVRIAMSTIVASFGVGAGCIPSNVVAREHRAVSTSVFEEEIPGKPWVVPRADAVAGFWRSVRITGEVAASLAEISYAFGQSGKYSGAALSYGADHPSFEVLAGEWSVEPDGLHLDGELVRSRMREGLLELAAEAGSVFLQRIDLE